ncbi:UPF0545 protein C22orf39 homolog [Patella vulgata]|uniref:UPF0545 protein C22orf39 homolog n=1 Tax=Patella vulgata TaxID=6465 RepID=UPI00218041F1|nr:UPF0545 protein C22orf39 homolog [Patella vulgata]
MSAPSEENGAADIFEDAWLVRPCEMYSEEYLECKSWKGRFHQKYIFGETLDCRKWKENYDNCMKFRNYKDTEAMKKVIEDERLRREKRLAAARDNNTWEYRREPPEDWNRPLPEWSKLHEQTRLAKYQQLKEEGKLAELDKYTVKMCVIS